MSNRPAPGDSSAAGLAARVVEDYGLDLVRLEPVGLGADGSAELWRGEDADGAAWVVRLHAGGGVAGLLVPAHLAARGVSGIVAPLLTRSGELWTMHGGRRVSVAPWIDARRALEGDLGERHWHRLGALLARVHATTLPEAVRKLLPVEEHRPEQVVTAARGLDGRLSSPGALPEASGDPLTWAAGQLWRSATPAVRTLALHAAELGTVLGARSTPLVLCHGDPHLGNVLYAGEDEVWLVDWDDALLAPRERDLMFVVEGVLAFAPLTDQQRGWFFDGYGPVELDAEQLAYFTVTSALVDLVDWTVQAADPSLPPVERTEALEIVRGLLSGTGLVSLALAALVRLGRVERGLPGMGLA